MVILLSRIFTAVHVWTIGYFITFTLDDLFHFINELLILFLPKIELFIKNIIEAFKIEPKISIISTNLRF